jgi:hypothetical protein
VDDQVRDVTHPLIFTPDLQERRPNCRRSDTERAALPCWIWQLRECREDLHSRTVETDWSAVQEL